MDEDMRSMHAGTASRTAAYMALFRAIESARPAGKRLFADPFAAAFLDRPLRLAAFAARFPVVGELVPRYIDRRWPGPRPSGVVRTRVIDDAVRDALAEGCSQLVLLGAGYDTRAYRLPELAEIETFEVDHPITQDVKRAVLGRVLPNLPSRAHFVPLDFERDSLAAALVAAGFRPGAPTCVVWEGVFSYLTIGAIDRTLNWAVTACATGSRLVLTYVDEAVLRWTGKKPAWIAAVDNAGEPFITGLDPTLAAKFFAERGLHLLADESTRDSAERLDPGAAPAIPDFYRVAVLEVGTQR
jgi:methyltransferase (TIGR00027 family)